MSAQASLRSWGMPSSLAMIFADPPGKITKGTPDPIRPLIASMSVPSPPKTARASTPSLTAALANLIASPASWVIDACHLMPASFMDRLRTGKTDSPLPAAGLIITRILPIFFSIVTFILTLFYYRVNPRWLFGFRLSVLSNSCIIAMRQNDPKHKTREQERCIYESLITQQRNIVFGVGQQRQQFRGDIRGWSQDHGNILPSHLHCAKTKRANVEFFASAHDALLAGYRPCKVCTPLEYKGTAPDWLKPLLAEINDDPLIRLRDSDLRARGLDPSRVSYWFKRHHEMTFQAYLRALRIGQAFGRIKHGERVTGTALESGYESLSGV